MAGWITYSFKSLSTIFQSYQSGGRVIMNLMKGFVRQIYIL